MPKPIAVLIPMVLFAGCASTVHVPYPDSVEADTGRLTIEFTRPLRAVNVQIDGRPVVRDVHAETIEIRGLPVGERVVEVTSSDNLRPLNHQEVVVIEANRTATIEIASPPISPRYYPLIVILVVVALLPTLL